MPVFEVDAAVTILIEAKNKHEAMEKASGRPLREWSGPHMVESQVHRREDREQDLARTGS